MYLKINHLINSNILLIGSVTIYGMAMTIFFFDFYFFLWRVEIEFTGRELTTLPVRYRRCKVVRNHKTFL